MPLLTSFSCIPVIRIRTGETGEDNDRILPSYIWLHFPHSTTVGTAPHPRDWAGPLARNHQNGPRDRRRYAWGIPTSVDFERPPPHLSLADGAVASRRSRSAPSFGRRHVLGVGGMGRGEGVTDAFATVFIPSVRAHGECEPGGARAVTGEGSLSVSSATSSRDDYAMVLAPSISVLARSARRVTAWSPPAVASRTASSC